MSSSSSIPSSHRNLSTLKLKASKNKPLPPIIVDSSVVPQQQYQVSQRSPVTPQLLSVSTSTSSISPLLKENTSATSSPQSSIFQPKTMKRRNLKKLTLNENSSCSPVASSVSSPMAKTPNSSSSSKNEDLELLENFEKLAVTINKELHIRQQDLLTLKTLGEGQSGIVSQVLHLPTNKIMAKKQVLFEKTFKVQNQILRELKILTEVRSPYIVDFYGGIFIDSSSTSLNGTSTDKTLNKKNSNNNHIESNKVSTDNNNDDDNNDNNNSNNNNKDLVSNEAKEVPSIHSNGVLIFMEFMDCGSLDDVLKKVGYLKEVYLSKITFSILEGLNYLYQAHKIIHRDIKPQNVLLNSRGEIKLIDFGVSRELNNNSIADTFVGTSTYMSPERIQGDVYSIKGDVWSVGLMLIELATGEFPFGKKDTPNGILDLLQRIVNEDPPSLPRTKYSKELCDFIDLCLQKQNDRPTPNELLSMPKSFMKKYDKEESGPLLRHLAKKLNVKKK